MTDGAAMGNAQVRTAAVAVAAAAALLLSGAEPAGAQSEGFDLSGTNYRIQGAVKTKVRRFGKFKIFDWNDPLPYNLESTDPQPPQITIFFGSATRWVAVIQYMDGSDGTTYTCNPFVPIPDLPCLQGDYQVDGRKVSFQVDEASLRGLAAFYDNASRNGLLGEQKNIALFSQIAKLRRFRGKLSEDASEMKLKISAKTSTDFDAGDYFPQPMTNPVLDQKGKLLYKGSGPRS